MAFPKEVAIVSSEATRENLARMGMERVKQQLADAPGAIAALRKQLASAPEGGARTRLQDEIAQQESYLAELSGFQLVLPDLTFDRSLILHRKGRDIYLLFLGRGHTSGDVVVYLPKEKVVATGDLLHGWLPFMADSFPVEWVATLDQLAKLDFDRFLGGHGGGKPRSHLTTFRNYLAELIEETRRARQRGEALDQATVSVKAALRPRFAQAMGGAERFDGSLGANVAKVYADLEAKLYP